MTSVLTWHVWVMSRSQDCLTLHTRQERWSCLQLQVCKSILQQLLFFCFVRTLNDVEVGGART